VSKDKPLHTICLSSQQVASALGDYAIEKDLVPAGPYWVEVTHHLEDGKIARTTLRLYPPKA
jgi:hypothetical protein